jgi:hypothetical protein
MPLHVCVCLCVRVCLLCASRITSELRSRWSSGGKARTYTHTRRGTYSSLMHMRLTASVQLQTCIKEQQYTHTHTSCTLTHRHTHVNAHVKIWISTKQEVTYAAPSGTSKCARRQRAAQESNQATQGHMHSSTHRSTHSSTYSYL